MKLDPLRHTAKCNAQRGPRECICPVTVDHINAIIKVINAVIAIVDALTEHATVDAEADHSLTVLGDLTEHRLTWIPTIAPKTTINLRGIIACDCGWHSPERTPADALTHYATHLPQETP